MFNDFTDHRKSNFPDGFLWGASEAAYSIEGNSGRKEENIWDRFSRFSGKIPAGFNRDKMCDHYHRFEEDLELLLRMGASAYCFSISWSRIFPLGKGGPDKDGLAFYKRLIERILDNDLKPFVTLYYWDLPQALQEKGGWTNRDTAFYFNDYAAFCAEHFGEQVKRWITMNDPWQHAFAGHFFGSQPPGISDLKGAWTVLHNLLLANSTAADIIREIGGTGQKTGINLKITPVYPLNPNPGNRKAAELYDAFINGSVLEPVFKGTYPEILTDYFKDFLPAISREEMKIINRPPDFLGLNYYSCCRVKAATGKVPLPIPVEVAAPEGETTDAGLEIHPEGLRETIDRLCNDYNIKEIFITENGAAFKKKPSEDGRIIDSNRIDFLRKHLSELSAAIKNGAPVKGYFVWSLLDGFQWEYGASMPYGLVHVDLHGSLARTPKESFYFFSKVIDENGLSPEDGW